MDHMELTLPKMLISYVSSNRIKPHAPQSMQSLILSGPNLSFSSEFPAFPPDEPSALIRSANIYQVPVTNQALGWVLALQVCIEINTLYSKGAYHYHGQSRKTHNSRQKQVSRCAF